MILLLQIRALFFSFIYGIFFSFTFFINKNILLSKNSIINDEPTLTTSSNNTSDASGLYSSTATNTGEPTYYFRGAVENNYVSFAGFSEQLVKKEESPKQAITPFGTFKINNYNLDYKRCAAVCQENFNNLFGFFSGVVP